MVIDANSKRCAACKMVQSVDSFGPSKQTSDGLYPYCKKCHSMKTLRRLRDNPAAAARKAAYNAKWVKRNPEQHREYIARYANSPKGKEARKRIAREWEKSAAGLAWRAKWKKKNKEKLRAHWAVNRALSKGLISKPSTCEECGSNSPVEAHHHKGYAKAHRLNVVWLCRSCHGKK